MAPIAPPCIPAAEHAVVQPSARVCRELVLLSGHRSEMRPPITIYCLASQAIGYKVHLIYPHRHSWPVPKTFGLAQSCVPAIAPCTPVVVYHRSIQIKYRNGTSCSLLGSSVRCITATCGVRAKLVDGCDARQSGEGTREGTHWTP